ncbi:MAG: hypothetical protein IKV94_02255 [Clostridia bacterium]|nr:hypothetical protein [Clostridia bacterium]
MKFEVNLNKKNYRLYISLEGDSTFAGLPTAKIKSYARAIFTNHEFGNDISEIVYCIKTVFRNYRLRKLEVAITESKFPQRATYIMDDLYTYEASIVLSEQEGFVDKVEVEYCETYGLNIKATNDGCDLTDPTMFDTVMTFIEQCKYTVDNLKDVYPKMSLSSDERVLIEIYRQFYKTEPDFSDKNIFLYFSTMIYLLEQFGIEVFDFEQYYAAAEDGIECSEMETMLRKLIPWNNEYYFVKLNDEFVEDINTVSTYVVRYLNKSNNKIDSLKKIGLVHYATFGCLTCQFRNLKNIRKMCKTDISEEELKELIVLFNEVIDNITEKE